MEEGGSHRTTRSNKRTKSNTSSPKPTKSRKNVTAKSSPGAVTPDSVKSNENVLVVGKIYANWCGHCKSLMGPWSVMKKGIRGEMQKRVSQGAKHLEGMTIHVSEIEEAKKDDGINNINTHYLDVSSPKLEASGFPTIYKIYRNKLSYYNSGDRSPKSMTEWFLAKPEGDVIGGGKSKKRRTGRRKRHTRSNRGFFGLW